jgi:hypothetical protein
MLAILSAFAFAACGGDPQPVPDPATDEEAVMPASLADSLKARAEESAAKIPPEVMKLFQKAGAELAASDLLAQAKSVGAKAPDFTLADGTGREVELAALRMDGPVVVTFYRGKW